MITKDLKRYYQIPNNRAIQCPQVRVSVVTCQFDGMMPYAQPFTTMESARKFFMDSLDSHYDQRDLTSEEFQNFKDEMADNGFCEFEIEDRTYIFMLSNEFATIKHLSGYCR